MTLLLTQAVLAILAMYHLVTGALALVAPSKARQFARNAYGAEFVDAAPMDYLVSMIGAQALAIGVLAAVAMPDPAGHRAVVAALALLQLLRAIVRVVRARVLRDSLGVSPQRNVVMVVVLLVEVAVLATFLS